jgi:hypothetical protein
MSRSQAAREWHSVASVAKFCGIALTLVLAVCSGAGAYYTIVARIDRLDDRMVQQGKSLESLAGSIAKLADEALTAADLKAACLQMQISNQARGWVCPFATVEVKPSPRRAARAPEPWSLFGVAKQ